MACFVACSSDPQSPAPAAQPPNTTVPTSDLDAIKWAPSFPPDVNTLQPRPGVDVVDPRLSDGVVVLENELRFPAATSQDVANWAPGRVVVGAPSAVSGNARNAFGFARRVVSVTRAGDTFVVATDRLNLSDVVIGDLRVRLDDNPAAKEVDLAQVDLDWAAANLYDNNPNNFFMPSFEGLVDDASSPSAGAASGAPVGGQGLRPLFSLGGALRTVGNKVGGAAQAFADTAQTVVSAVTPANFSDAGSFTSTIEDNFEPQTFVKDFFYEKQVRQSPPITVGVRINRIGMKSGKFKLNPGTQFAVSIPNPANTGADPVKVDLDIQARSEFSADFEYDIEASARSGGGGAVEIGALALNNAFIDSVASSAAEKKAVYDDLHRAVFGDPDLKLPGGWKRVLYITKPKAVYVQAGPVPVLVTVTVQFDLQCGFMAKGTVKGELGFKHAGAFGFSGGYVSGGNSSIKPPAFTQATNVVKNTMTGGGELTVSCGVVPRVNALLYDSVGIGVGIRSSLGTKIVPQRVCPGTDARPASPRGRFNFDFSAELAAQISGRVQPPGASLAQKAGEKLGVEVGPAEPFFRSFPLGTASVDVGTVFGVCPGAPGAPVPAAAPGAPSCGGAAPGCAVSAGCAANSDCARPATCSAGVCAVGVSCTNGVQDGVETGPDCGGSCPNKCGLGTGCKDDADCAQGTCSQKTWQCVSDRCNDGKRNGDELGTDCGGPTCRKCRVGEVCLQPNGATPHCESGYVYNAYCAAGVCSNGAKDANESDVDCGGTSICGKCNPGASCTSNADCQPGSACASEGGRMACKAPQCGSGGKNGSSPPPACNDSVQNCSETDTDCGGVCSKCGTGRKCISGADCDSAVCTAGVCVAAACSDGVKNAGETGVDCGGPTCPKCGAGQACQSGSDCESRACNAGVCTAATCTDGVKNAAETDVDCGGPTCPKCALNKTCNFASDCALNICTSGTCRDSSCSDGIKNGKEVDVDCGGSDCNKCAVGKMCVGDSGCLSNSCMGGTCQAPTCTDGRKNGAETDVDCGGAACTKCAAGKACGAPADCASNLCTGGVCEALQCQNGVKDGTETDVDCGGPTCAKCGPGKTCATNADCQTATSLCSASQLKCVSFASCGDGLKNNGEDFADCGGDACVQWGKLCNAANTGLAGNPAGGTFLDNVGLGDFSIKLEFRIANNSVDVALADQRAGCANDLTPKWMAVIDGVGNLWVLLQGAAGATFLISPGRVNHGSPVTAYITRSSGIYYMNINQETVRIQADIGLNFTPGMAPVRSGTNECQPQYAAFPNGVGGQYLFPPTVRVRL
jgi:hypothetical protein